jgi:hypothetical protein
VVREQTSEHNQLAGETKQSRRERRRVKEKAEMPQHGKSLARVYKDAALNLILLVIRRLLLRGPIILLICLAIGFAIVYGGGWLLQQLACSGP